MFCAIGRAITLSWSSLSTTHSAGTSAKWQCHQTLISHSRLQISDEFTGFASIALATSTMADPIQTVYHPSCTPYTLVDVQPTWPTVFDRLPIVHLVLGYGQQSRRRIRYAAAQNEIRGTGFFVRWSGCLELSSGRTTVTPTIQLYLGKNWKHTFLI